MTTLTPTAAHPAAIRNVSVLFSAWKSTRAAPVEDVELPTPVELEELKLPVLLLLSAVLEMTVDE